MKKIYTLFLLMVAGFPFASFAGSDKKNNKATENVVTPDSSECYAEKKVKVCGQVYGYYYNTKINGSPTFLDMGASYPNSSFTVLIEEKDLPNFNYDLQTLVNNDVCFTGVVTVYNDKSEMFVETAQQVSLYIRPKPEAPKKKGFTLFAHKSKPQNTDLATTK